MERNAEKKKPDLKTSTARCCVRAGQPVLSFQSSKASKCRGLERGAAPSKGAFMAVLDVLDVERLIRKAGADRVSEEAGYALSEVLEEKAIAIAERALRIAKYAHKRTVTRKDIELAMLYETRKHWKDDLDVDSLPIEEYRRGSVRSEQFPISMIFPSRKAVLEHPDRGRSE